MEQIAPASNAAFRRVVLAVALLNLAYFGVEFAGALAIGPVSLFADSVDFPEDASVNLDAAREVFEASREEHRVAA